MNVAVKAGFISARWRVCSGGSMFSRPWPNVSPIDRRPAQVVAEVLAAAQAAQSGWLRGRPCRWCRGRRPAGLGDKAENRSVLDGQAGHEGGQLTAFPDPARDVHERRRHMSRMPEIGRRCVARRLRRRAREALRARAIRRPARRAGPAHRLRVLGSDRGGSAASGRQHARYRALRCARHRAVVARASEAGAARRSRRSRWPRRGPRRPTAPGRSCPGAGTCCSGRTRLDRAGVSIRST